jgi:two-component system, LuxR family, sensor kinase FixL
MTEWKPMLCHHSSTPSTPTGSPLQEAQESEKMTSTPCESEQRLNAIVNGILTGVFIVDISNHRIVDVNPQAAAMIGLPSDQIIGRVCHHFICLAEEGKCPITDLSQNIDRSERTLLKANGQPVPILKTVTPAAWGGHEYLIESFIEISELKKTQESLKESVSLLNATLESTADGVLVVDRDGKIKSFNQQFKDIWQIPDAILDTRSDDEAVKCILGRVKDPEAFVAKIRELCDTPEQEHFDVTEMTDGRILERYSKPQRVGNQIIGRVWSFRDVTARYQAEKKQAELMGRVAQINEELTHFAYVVSHDLKAPLRGIKLLTEWLCADYADKLGDQAKEQLALLQSRVQRMHNLIEGVLQYSRVGRVREDMVTVDLNELIPSIVDIITPPAHIHIQVEGTLPSLICEKTRVTQVFQNLLTNAVKYMDKPEGRIRITCRDQGDFWEFSVIDNGPGIEEKYFERIFKIFQTLAPKDECDSTGVGLTIVKKIVELYGGKVWVESIVGQGTTFLFTWPKQDPAGSAEPQTAAASESPQPATVQA